MSSDPDRKKKVSLLEHVPLFAGLSAAQMDFIARHSVIQTYSEGAALCAPGSFEGRLHAIGSGSILVTRTGEDGSERVLARYIAGESFGELDLFGATAPAYTATVTEAGEVCSFPAPQFDAENVLEENAPLGADIAERLMHEIGERTRSANSLVSEKAPWIEGLRNQILTDKLTGLPNVTYLNEEMPRIVEKAGGNGFVCMFKPDNFKEVNDTYGHDAGDAVLMMLATLLKSNAVDGRCARFKGDVFCIVVDAEQDAEDHAKSLLEEVKKIDITDHTGGDSFTLTACVGLAGATSETVEEAYLNAFNRVMQLREERGDQFDWYR